LKIRLAKASVFLPCHCHLIFKLVQYFTAIFSHLSSSILLVVFVETPLLNWRCPKGC